MESESSPRSRSRRERGHITFGFYHEVSNEEVSIAFSEARKLATRMNDLRGLANLLAQHAC